MTFGKADSLIDYKLECKDCYTIPFFQYSSRLIDYKLECKGTSGAWEHNRKGGLIDYKLECKVVKYKKIVPYNWFNRLQIGM